MSNQPGLQAEVSGLNSWRPDWRQTNLYPDPETASLKNWAWQFLRRSKKYQEAYAWAKSNLLPERALLNEIWFEDVTDSQEFRTKFGSLGLRPLYVIDPEHDFTENMELMFRFHLERFPELKRYSDDLNPRALFEQDKHMGWVTQEVPLVPADTNEIVLKFDLRLSIPKQLKKAQKLLEGECRSAIGNSNRRGPQTQDGKIYRRYLRILDARHRQVSYPEILQCLQHTGEFPPDRDRVPDESTLSRNHSEAEAICNGGYANLIIAYMSRY